MTEKVRTPYPTAKLQFKFNQKLIWILLKLISQQSNKVQEILSGDVGELVDIQTEIREIVQSSPTNTKREEE